MAGRRSGIWFDSMGRPIGNEFGAPILCDHYPLCCPLTEANFRTYCPCVLGGSTEPREECCPIKADKICCGPCLYIPLEDSSGGEESSGSEESSGGEDSSGGEESSGAEDSSGGEDSSGDEDSTGSEESSGGEDSSGSEDSSGGGESSGGEDSSGDEESIGGEDSTGGGEVRYSAYFAVCYWREDEKGNRYQCRIDLVVGNVWASTGSMSFLGSPGGLKVGQETTTFGGEKMIAVQIPPGDEYRAYGFNGLDLTLLMMEKNVTTDQLLAMVREQCQCPAAMAAGTIEVYAQVLQYRAEVQRDEIITEEDEYCVEWDEETGDCLRVEHVTKEYLGPLIGIFSEWQCNNDPNHEYCVSREYWGTPGICRAYYKACAEGTALANADFARWRSDQSAYVLEKTYTSLGLQGGCSESSTYDSRWARWILTTRFVRLRMERMEGGDPHSVGVRIVLNARLVNTGEVGSADETPREIYLHQNTVLSLQYGEVFTFPVVDNLVTFQPPANVLDHYCPDEQFHWSYAVEPYDVNSRIQTLVMEYRVLSYIYDSL